MGKTYKVIGGAVLGTDNKVYQIGDKVDERWINPKLYGVNNGFLTEANEEKAEEAPQGEQEHTINTTGGGDEGENSEEVKEMVGERSVSLRRWIVRSAGGIRTKSFLWNICQQVDRRMFRV